VNLKREYKVLVGEAGRRRGYENWPGSVFRSNARIRTFAVTLFRHWFGREPQVRWHKDGFMCEVRDRRGNFMEVEQTNWGHPRFKPVLWKQMQG
jgi:hypothetical protein